MLKQDNIEIEILPDGTIKFTTDPISLPNHMSAETFLKETARLAGGETKRTKRVKGLRDISEAFHNHTADGHTHEQ